jgi:transposase
LEPGLPATNYLAELALRTPIVNRKVFGGNRTEAGCHAQVITSSTIQTCRQQKRSAFRFLRDAVCGLVKSIFNAVSD